MEYSHGGNLIDDNWIGREYEWDQFNRVTMVKSATGTPLYGFEYGGTGERTVQNAYSGGLVSTTRAFLYDREDVIAEFSNDTFATLFRQYIHGPGIDEPLAILGSGGTGSFNEGYSYYLHDGLGSVTGMVNESGKLIGSIDYSAFGETRLNTVKIENRYRYTSREFVETNLYYYRARHMRPDLGRFISMDPWGMLDGPNKYTYVLNDPLSFTDPMGLMRGPCAWNIYWEEWAEMQADGRDSFHHCVATCRIFSECGKFSGWSFFSGGHVRESFQMLARIFHELTLNLV